MRRFTTAVAVAGLGLPLLTVSGATADARQHTAAATLSANGVGYWLDRPPGDWTGGMVVVRRGGKYWAYARFFEGRACLSGRRDGPKVRMRGAFEYATVQAVAVTWRISNGMPKVRFTVGTAGEWRQVSPSGFQSGTTMGDRLVQVAKVTTPKRWRSACSWA